MSSRFFRDSSLEDSSLAILETLLSSRSVGLRNCDHSGLIVTHSENDGFRQASAIGGWDIHMTAL